LTRSEGNLKATPLLVVLVAVETTDLVFAVDSIPAILAITQDAFIVFTSNIFAILGLRSFYFALSGIMQLFRFLSYGLAAVLTFIGVKMLISGYYHIPIEISLGLIALLLGSSVTLSLLLPEKTNPGKNIG
jgi:tellurite resistance protein TerC